ncbi:Acetylene hydratase [invertebrate metagenome]|uniref:Acetylene hydratase n=1 Tax=invertebrate metagenome TaxID=1711999 RepID=A0A2H9T8K9_9ZZZZ
MSVDFIPLFQDQVATTCSLCGINCRIIVKAESAGKLSVTGDKRDTVTHGAICKKGRDAITLMGHPDRLRSPLKHCGKKGEGKWQTISWQEAFDYTAEQFRRIQEGWEPNSLFMAYGYSKDFMYTQLLRLANRLNTVSLAGPETVCWAPTKLGCEYTLGFYPGHDIHAQTKCVVLWGVNKYKTRFTDLVSIQNALQSGTKMVCIDPQYTRHAAKSDYWLAVKPGADLALAMAMLKVIIKEKLYDNGFVSQWCYGFDALQQSLSEYSLPFFAQQCGIDAEDIRSVARLYACSKPSVIITGNALDHNSDSFQVNRSIAMLMAITGNIDVPGGQYQSNSVPLVSGRWPYDEQDVNELSPQARSKSAGTPLLPEYFRATSQGLIRAMLTDQPYPIKGGIVVGANPMTSWPDTHKVHEALSGLEFLAVSELFMTPTAMMADIVFPAASFLEFDGVTQGQDGSVRFQQKVMKVGDCKPDYAIIAGIGAAMKVMEAPAEEVFWNGFLKTGEVNYSTLKNKGIVYPSEVSKHYRKYENAGFPTESGKVELCSDVLAAMGTDRLPVYRQLVPDNPDYPMRLTGSKPKHYMFSHGRQSACLRKAHPYPEVRIHPDTATQLQLREGEEVAIEVPGGKVIYQRLKTDNYLALNVAVADLSWWFPEQGEKSLGNVFHSNVNVLTSIEPGSYGWGEAGSFMINGLPCRLKSLNGKNDL